MTKKNPMFNLEYGLYLVSTKSESNHDNACVINAVMQISDTPNTIAISINKLNHTDQTIRKTKIFNLLPLASNATFDVIERFGFKSGNDTNKLDGMENVKRSSNGLVYFEDFCNSVICCEVIKEIDCGSHTLYYAKVSECETLNDNKTMSYSYYHSDVKPKPKPTDNSTKGFRCVVCGYVYEGETLPDDFICPLCKHSVEDFVEIT